jgi:hypothetical protein
MVKLYEYDVVGTSTFPFDMLRYDRAWPKYESETPKLDTYLERMQRGARKVTMQSHKKPTVERWDSFGWQVSNLKEHRV